MYYFTCVALGLDTYAPARTHRTVPGRAILYVQLSDCDWASHCARDCCEWFVLSLRRFRLSRRGNRLATFAVSTKLAPSEAAESLVDHSIRGQASKPNYRGLLRSFIRTSICPSASIRVHHLNKRVVSSRDVSRMSEASSNVVGLVQNATTSLTAVNDWAKQQHWSTHNLPNEADVDAVSPTLPSLPMTRPGLNGPRADNEAAGAGWSDGI